VKPRAAIDATGMETRHTSRYFVWRAGKRHHRRSSWPKLTAVLEARSHLFLSAHVSRGPSQDSPQFKPAARAACGRCPVDTLLGDTGYDAEHNHAYARERLKVRSTVMPLNRRNGGRKWPKTRYRRQMVKRFRKKRRGSRHKRVYGQRWQVESGFSRKKRLLGSALRAGRWVNQKKEILFRVLTHNLMLLAAG
jgi:Transposase DDE domain